MIPITIEQLLGLVIAWAGLVLVIVVGWKRAHHEYDRRDPIYALLALVAVAVGVWLMIG